jgi:hypothetical protein
LASSRAYDPNRKSRHPEAPQDGFSLLQSLNDFIAAHAPNIRQEA